VPASPVQSAVPAGAWAGAALFLASLGYFLFTYAVTFGEETPGPLEVTDLAWNVALFSGFALHHSVFARSRIRAVVARTMPPEAERPLYVVLASVLFIVVCGLWRPLAGLVWAADGLAAGALASVQLGGVWLSVRSAAVIDIRALAGLTPPAPGPVTFRLDGPYGHVRHPIYTGWFLMVFATPTMTATRLAFALVSSAYILIAIPLEERTLLATHGEAYGRYAAHVRWKLVPGLY
jgi:protein-S-isoprenylcysteine O-methyltransferase Ste14